MGEETRKGGECIFVFHKSQTSFRVTDAIGHIGCLSRNEVRGGLGDIGDSWS